MESNEEMSIPFSAIMRLHRITVQPNVRGSPIGKISPQSIPRKKILSSKQSCDIAGHTFPVQSPCMVKGYM
jgi:hypothetical protein